MRPVFVLLFVGASFLNIEAQEIRVIDGRKFIVHKVEQGQTLFAIGRNYAVDVDDITNANPGSEYGIGIGQELLIPQASINKKEARTAPILAADGELIHTVARKETLFGIARKYEVDINALLQRNPSLNAGLREGMTVVIPVQKVSGQPEAVLRPAKPERLLEHIVQPGETLYSLGRLYAVAPELITAANDGLPEGLKTGSTVLIPLRIGVDPPKPVVEETYSPGHRYNIGLMLPFSIGKNDSVLATITDEPRFYELSRIAAQFYGGAQMALDSLETLGLNANVQVLDQGDEARVWNSVLRKPEINEIDMFIGPFHRSAIEDLVRTNSTAHIVCPVPQTNKLLLGNPTVSKVTPTRSDLIKHTARYVAQRHCKENVIMLRPDIFSDKDAQDQMFRGLQDGISERPSRSRDSLLVLGQGDREIPDLTPHLDAGKLNVIVAPSEDVEYVTGLIGKLRPLAAKFRIMVVGLESWLNYETVAASDLDLLSFTFAASTFIDREDPMVRAFSETYYDRFQTEPDEYAFLGFDVTFYYLKALMKFGPGFHHRFADVRSEPLHMGFRMMRAGPENGFRNEHAIMLQQKDLRLMKAP